MVTVVHCSCAGDNLHALATLSLERRTILALVEVRDVDNDQVEGKAPE